MQKIPSFKIQMSYSFMDTLNMRSFKIFKGKIRIFLENENFYTKNMLDH